MFRLQSDARAGNGGLQGALGWNTAARGKMILISVNSPGCVSTSIDPPCCLTMMS